MFRRPFGIPDFSLYGETMKTVWQILIWIWQAPQNIVGLILRLCYPWKPIPFNGVDVVVDTRFKGGISLGRTIIVRKGYPAIPDTWKHEYGHSRQSLYLGPLYLLIVGLPSLLWAWYWNPSRGRSYYSFYTEKWADKLGGVERK